jgi:glycine/serine hydroxymethyltransferase
MEPYIWISLPKPISRFFHRYVREYHKSKNILRVKGKLGHKSINSTIIYKYLIDFEAEEYTSRVVKNIEETQKLVDAGFEYVCDYAEEGKCFVNVNDFKGENVKTTLELSLCLELRLFSLI